MDDFGLTNFQDPYSYGDNLDPLFTSPQSIYAQDSFGGWLERKLDKEGYEVWKANMDKAYERESTKSARAWDLYFDSTATQRRVADLKAAGLNPWLAVSGGSGIGNSANERSASNGGNARTNASHKGGSIGAGLFGLAKLIQVLALL